MCVRSHLDKTTTWHDPRLSQLQSAASQHPISGAPVHAHSLSNPASTTQPQNINPDAGINLTTHIPLTRSLHNPVSQNCLTMFNFIGSCPGLWLVSFLQDFLLVFYFHGSGVYSIKREMGLSGCEILVQCPSKLRAIFRKNSGGSSSVNSEIFKCAFLNKFHNDKLLDGQFTQITKNIFSKLY